MNRILLLMFLVLGLTQSSWAMGSSDLDQLVEAQSWNQLLEDISAAGPCCSGFKYDYSLDQLNRALASVSGAQVDGNLTGGLKTDIIRQLKVRGAMETYGTTTPPRLQHQPQPLVVPTSPPTPAVPATPAPQPTSARPKTPASRTKSPDPVVDSATGFNQDSP